MSVRACVFCRAHCVFHDEEDGCRCLVCSREATCPHPRAPRRMAEDIADADESSTRKQGRPRRKPAEVLS